MILCQVGWYSRYLFHSSFTHTHICMYTYIYIYCGKLSPQNQLYVQLNILQICEPPTRRKNLNKEHHT